MEKLQFLYQLKLIPALLDENNWTEKENNIVQHHFDELQSWQRQGKLILAGRTLNIDSSGFGIVILEVDSYGFFKFPLHKKPFLKPYFSRTHYFGEKANIWETITIHQVTTIIHQAKTKIHHHKHQKR